MEFHFPLRHLTWEERGNGQQTLTDDSLITVLAEVESIINSRPLTMEKWPIGKVIQTFPDKSRRVRQVPNTNSIQYFTQTSDKTVRIFS